MLNKLKSYGIDEANVNRWAKEINHDGLAACEQLIANEKGPFCFGAEPTLADICLVPQLVNARRFGADVSGFKRILEAKPRALHCQRLRTRRRKSRVTPSKRDCLKMFFEAAPCEISAGRPHRDQPVAVAPASPRKSLRPPRS